MIRKVLITPGEVVAELSTMNPSVLAFDTETTHLDYLAQGWVGLSMTDGQKVVYIDFLHNQMRHEIYEYLKQFFSKVKVLVGHNLPFDLALLDKYGIPYKHCELFDTQVAFHLLNEESRETGLKHLAFTYLGAETKDYKTVEAEGVHSAEFYNYALNDAEWTWKLMVYFKEQLKAEDGLLKLFREVEMPFVRVLVQMRIEGVLVDQDRVAATLKELQVAKLDVTKEIYKYLNEPFQIQHDLFMGKQFVGDINLSSPQQLATILFDRLKLEPIEKTPGGERSVGKLTLDKYKGHDFVKLLTRYKIIDKLISGFFKPLPEFLSPDGKVRPSFHNCGTATGRLSCSRPNLQQLPKVNKHFPIQTRACFVAPTGHKIISCDYSGQELRILAKLSMDEGLMKAFREGQDLHMVTANKMFELGIPDEQLFANHPGFDQLKEKYKHERDKAKIINFGIAYGKGAFGFSKDFGIDETEAQEFLDRYNSAFPGIEEARQTCVKEIERVGEVSTMFGRKRRFKKEKRDNWTGYIRKVFRQAFNFLIQGFAADMVRVAMVRVYSAAQKYPEYEIKAIGTVHDEAIYTCREEYVEAAMKLIKEQFEGVVQWEFPIVAEVSYGDNYGEAK